MELKLNLVLYCMVFIQPFIHLEVAFCIQGLLHNAGSRVFMGDPTCVCSAEAHAWLVFHLL